MFLLVTGQYRRRCVHIGRAAACALALGCVSGAPFAQSDESQVEKVVFDAGALFDFDASPLRPEGRATLDDFLGRLKGTSLGMIRAVGHADRLVPRATTRSSPKTAPKRSRPIWSAKASSPTACAPKAVVPGSRLPSPANAATVRGRKSSPACSPTGALESRSPAPGRSPIGWPAFDRK